MDNPPAIAQPGFGPLCLAPQPSPFAFPTSRPTPCASSLVFPCFPPAPGAYCDATTRFHGLQGNPQSRECQPTTGKPGRRLAFACIPAPSRGATSDHRPVWPPPLECGGKTPLLDQATCRLVQKRRRISGPTPHAPRLASAPGRPRRARNQERALRRQLNMTIPLTDPFSSSFPNKTVGRKMQ